MSLAERLAAPPKTTKSQCIVADILDGLCDNDEAALRAALGNPNFTAAYLSQALGDEGHLVSKTALQRHRQSGCCCVSR